MAFIYKITNNINGKMYIGKTDRDIETRWNEHIRHASTLKHIPLYRAINKYGAENFKIELVEECQTEILNEREQYWISYYDTYDKGYNCSLGGEGSLLKIPEDEIQEIITRYQAGERLDCLCKEFHHDYETIKRVFKERSIEIKTNAGPMKLAKKIYAIDPVTLQIAWEFESISAAARALCEEGKSWKALGTQLGRAKNTKRISHGYLWKTEECLAKWLKEQSRRS